MPAGKGKQTADEQIDQDDQMEMEEAEWTKVPTKEEKLQKKQKKSNGTVPGAWAKPNQAVRNGGARKGGDAGNSPMEKATEKKTKLKPSIRARVAEDLAKRNAIRIEMKTADGEDRKVTLMETILALAIYFKQDHLTGVHYAQARNILYVDCPSKEDALTLGEDGLEIPKGISGDGYTKVLPVLANTGDYGKQMIVDFEGDYGLTEQEKMEIGRELMEFCRSKYVPADTQVLEPVKIVRQVTTSWFGKVLTLVEHGFGIPYTNAFEIPPVWTDKNDFNYRIRIRNPCGKCNRRHDYTICNVTRKKLEKEAKERLRREMQDEQERNQRKEDMENSSDRMEADDSDDSNASKSSWTDWSKMMERVAREAAETAAYRSALLAERHMSRQKKLEQALDAFNKEAGDQTSEGEETTLALGQDQNQPMEMDMDTTIEAEITIPQSTSQTEEADIVESVVENQAAPSAPSTPGNANAIVQPSQSMVMAAIGLMNLSAQAAVHNILHTPTKETGKRLLIPESDESDLEPANALSKLPGTKYAKDVIDAPPGYIGEDDNARHVYVQRILAPLPEIPHQMESTLGESTQPTAQSGSESDL